MKFKGTIKWFKDLRKRNRCTGRCGVCNLDVSGKASNKLKGMNKQKQKEEEFDLKYYKEEEVKEEENDLLGYYEEDLP